MKTVGDILKKKGDRIWSVTPETKVYDALQLMALKEIGAVVVIKDDDLIGIMSERDYARKVILFGKFSKDVSVGEIMTTNVIKVAPSQSIDECMLLMTNKKIRHLPVMHDGLLTGIISVGDVVSAVISEKESVITQLENYISGTP
jgi:CBS domain-containing protein